MAPTAAAADPERAFHLDDHAGLGSVAASIVPRKELRPLFSLSSIGTSLFYRRRGRASTVRFCGIFVVPTAVAVCTPTRSDLVAAVLRLSPGLTSRLGMRYSNVVGRERTGSGGMAYKMGGISPDWLR